MTRSFITKNGVEFIVNMQKTAGMPLVGLEPKSRTISCFCPICFSLVLPQCWLQNQKHGTTFRNEKDPSRDSQNTIRWWVSCCSSGCGVAKPAISTWIWAPQHMSDLMYCRLLMSKTPQYGEVLHGGSLASHADWRGFGGNAFVCVCGRGGSET